MAGLRMVGTSFALAVAVLLAQAAGGLAENRGQGMGTAFQAPLVGRLLRAGYKHQGSFRSSRAKHAMPKMLQGGGEAKLPGVCSGMGQLADQYDAFLLDQWGVMHDGTKAHDGAIECMQQLAALGKKVVLLSNSSKRVGTSMKKLDRMGFDASAISGIVTGGDRAFSGLRDRERAPFTELGGNRVFLFGNGDDDDEYLKGCGLELALIEQADFVLARGMFTMQDDEDLMKRTGDDKFEMWDSEALRSLQIAASRYIPMLVTNPDLVRPDGNDSPMPGRLGSTYEQILASNMCAERIVHYVGKPHALVYDECFELLKAQGITDKSKVCGVGDSMLHDIVGAQRYGIDSVFVADGIHAEALGLSQAKPEQDVDASMVEGLRKDLMMSSTPTHVIPHFNW